MTDLLKAPEGVRRSIGKRSQKERGARPRLEDVARLAGVSTATVSRALNNQDAVRPELRRKVQEAVEALDYVPDGVARALASRRSNTFGAVIPTVDNAIFARGIQSLQARLYEAGFSLFLASTDYDPRRERDEVQSLIEHGIDGLMLVGEAHDPAVYELLARERIPYVNTWMYRTESPHPCIGIDNREAAAHVVRYLVNIGHRRIGMIAGITEANDRAADRVAGVKDAFSNLGLRITGGHLVESPYKIPDGRRAMASLLETPKPPTAVICGNDVLALGALFECQARGINVPGEMSITGFDDLDIARHLNPPLTTMRVPSQEMGRMAADYLLARLEGRPAHTHTQLEVSLIVRGTTAPPAG